MNDCYEGLLHIFKNASEFDINPENIVVGGGSIGGLLSTSIAIKARNENGPKIKLQLLSYPMLDHRNTSDSNKEINDVGVWDSWMNHYAFSCYLKDVPESEYNKAVPNMVENLSNLPDAYIGVGTMDCLRDEGIEYAQKLAQAGVQVELHIYPGMTHVFDALVPNSKAGKDFWVTRIAAVKRVFES